MRLPLTAFALVRAASSVLSQEPGNLWEVTTSMEGRGFTSPPAAKYRDFCSTYARSTKQDGVGDATPDSPAPTKENAMKDGANRLKGLFGL